MATILAVEDNRQVVDLLDKGLTARGHTLAFAGDGAEAIRLAKARRPDLAIVDLNLGPTSPDGVSVFESLRRSDARIKGVLITGYGTMTSALRAGQVASLAISRSPSRCAIS